MSNVVEYQGQRAVVDAHTAAEIKAQVNRIQEVMGAVMKKDAHYGVIPGTKKPTLYKAGSEVLLSTFRISVEPRVEDLSVGDEIRYRVHAVGKHMASGMVVGVGVGEASSSEEKYKWRKAVCDEEFDDTPEDRRRIKYQMDWGQRRGERVITKAKQIRTEPADVANTVLKMAKKRAQIDLTLTALAASDIFAQDLEDMPAEMREQLADEQPAAEHDAPQARSDQGLATPAQLSLIRKKLDNAALDETDLAKALEVESLDALPFAQVNAAMAWIKAQSKK